MPVVFGEKKIKCHVFGVWKILGRKLMKAGADRKIIRLLSLKGKRLLKIQCFKRSKNYTLNRKGRNYYHALEPNKFPDFFETFRNLKTIFNDLSLGELSNMPSPLLHLLKLLLQTINILLFILDLLTFFTGF